MVRTRGTLDIVTESQIIAEIYHVTHYGLMSQKSLQVDVNCLYRTSDPLRMLRNDVWAQLIIPWESPLANGALDASFGSHNTNF